MHRQRRMLPFFRRGDVRIPMSEHQAPGPETEARSRTTLNIENL
jgi:hypothetical protein